MTAEQTPPATTAANENTLIDQEALSLPQLARGVLNRDFRPRASSVRRLAEAVLTPAKPAAKSKKKTAKADKTGGADRTDGKSAKKKSRSKKRKLAKIPGQKGK